MDRGDVVDLFAETNHETNPRTASGSANSNRLVVNGRASSNQSSCHFATYCHANRLSTIRRLARNVVATIQMNDRHTANGACRNCNPGYPEGCRFRRRRWYHGGSRTERCPSRGVARLPGCDGDVAGASR